MGNSLNPRMKLILYKNNPKKISFYISNNIESVAEFSNQYHWSHEQNKWKNIKLIMSQSKNIFRIYSTMQKAHSC